MSDPACYYPFEKGKYEIKPGFFSLETDFGNGEQDRKIFQIDSSFESYRDQKLASRSESLDKYYLTDKPGDNVRIETLSFIIATLASQQPEYFRLQADNHGNQSLICKLTGETLMLDEQYRLISHNSIAVPVYRDTLDALACQVQEDLAIVEFDQNADNRLSAIHLCFPNHWSAADKIGHGFSSVHQPVPGIDKVSSNSVALMRGIISKGPFVRFAWGLATDQRLNHHPEPPPGVDTANWNGRRFNRDDPELYVRVERQVSRATRDAMLFTIRTSFIDCRKLKANGDKARQLVSAIESMSDASLRYKGIAMDKKNIIEWLLE